MNGLAKTILLLYDYRKVEILGALIPGFLFICICCLYGIILAMPQISLSFTWPVFIVFILLSIGVGFFLFLLDISRPDRKSIKRSIKNEIERAKKRFKKQDIYNEAFIDNEFINRADRMYKTLERAPLFFWDERNAAYGLYSALVVTMDTCKEIKMSNEKLSLPLCLRFVFPGMSSNMAPPLDRLSIVHQYQRRICPNCHTHLNFNLSFKLAMLCILDIQCETGCIDYKGENDNNIYGLINENSSTYPYPFYYKYLLSHNKPHLLNNIIWDLYAIVGRSSMNLYEYGIYGNPQVHSRIRDKEAYIRMQSSLWYMSTILKWTTPIIFVAHLLYVLFPKLWWNENIWQILHSIIGIPLFTFILIFILSETLQRTILEKFHDMRMDEIQEIMSVHTLI